MSIINPDFLAIVDRVVQWLVIPAFGVILMVWRDLNKRHQDAAIAIKAANDRMEKSEKETLRILTILEERNGQRQEDRVHLSEAITRLDETVKSLQKEINMMWQRQSGGGGK